VPVGMLGTACGTHFSLGDLHGTPTRRRAGAVTLAMAVTLGWMMFLVEVSALVWLIVRHHR